MISIDHDALVCDLAQYYHVYELRKLPLETVAILACGLPRESRIIRILSGSNVDMQTLMSACILDYLAILVWFQTKDGHQNRNRPKSYVQILMGKEDEKKEEKEFRSPEDFEAERKKIAKRIKTNGLRTGEGIRSDNTNDKGNKGSADKHPGRGGRRSRKKRRK